MLPLLLLACSSSTTPGSTSDPLHTVPTSSTEPTGHTADTATSTTTPTTEVDPLCSFDAELRSCPHSTVTVNGRDVHVQRPDGTPPPNGWPVAILFQGSFFSAAFMWEAAPGDPYGAWYQTGTVGVLLDAGFAVVTPEAIGDGATYWTTNIPPYNLAWTTSPDHDLMLALFDAFEDGSFADVDPDRLYAAGISSGGYMTSRMADAYPGRFRALAVHSASWATCGGALCVLPRSLPADHPPTLFLHGERDLVVPVGTMEGYAEALEDQGIDVSVVTDPAVGHAWLPAAPSTIRDWFLAYP